MCCELPSYQPSFTSQLALSTSDTLFSKSALNVRNYTLIYKLTESRTHFTYPCVFHQSQIQNLGLFRLVSHFTRTSVYTEHHVTCQIGRKVLPNSRPSPKLTRAHASIMGSDPGHQRQLVISKRLKQLSPTLVSTFGESQYLLGCVPSLMFEDGT